VNCGICHEPIVSVGSLWTHTHGDVYCGCGDGSVATPPDSITCPQCGRTSHNPNDVRERYCGYCHQYHDTMSRKE
jgi:hypothetical protein